MSNRVGFNLEGKKNNATALDYCKNLMREQAQRHGVGFFKLKKVEAVYLIGVFKKGSFYE